MTTPGKSRRLPHQIPLAEFLGAGRTDALLHVQHDDVCLYDLDDVDDSRRIDTGGAEFFVCVADGDATSDYFVAPLKHSSPAGRGDVVAFDSDGEAVGQLVSGVLMVVPEHRGQGLGALLVVAATLDAGGPLRVGDYTPAGNRAFRRAHRAAVENALQVAALNPELPGWQVPVAVLADYPDLAACLSLGQDAAEAEIPAP